MLCACVLPLCCVRVGLGFGVVAGMFSEPLSAGMHTHGGLPGATHAASTPVPVRERSCTALVFLHKRVCMCLSKAASCPMF